MNMRVQTETKRPLSKYAAKRKAMFADLTQEDQTPKTIQAIMKAAMNRENNPVVSLPVRLECMLRERLYSREGSIAYHQGNPFAVALNKELNRKNST